MAEQIVERREKFAGEVETYVSTLGQPGRLRECAGGHRALGVSSTSSWIPIVESGDATAAAELAAGPACELGSAVSDAFGAEQARQGADAQRDSDAAQEVASASAA